ncbi:hypothetical protein [Caldimonas tepidiphila]|uniref:hypothetical protein n=1 Tax=Caldimonas tepidiphila TaxID=2315841 RepID=UPI000E5A71F3|nr:hypothetical protein [Caldimonas tepidiphila]
MSRVLVGVFDHMQEARGLYEELVNQHGFHPREIRVTAASPTAHGIAGGEHAPSVQEAVDRSNSVQSSIGDLFRSLFVRMGGKSDDERLYDEAVRRGSIVVMVQADSDARVRAVSEAMQRHKVVDIESRGEPARAGRRDEAAAAPSAEDDDERRRVGRFMSGDPDVESIGGIRVYRSAAHPQATPGGRSEPPPPGSRGGAS